jgi:dihydroorotate dehydrogenase
MFFIGPPFGNYIKLDNLVPIRGSFTLEPRSGLIGQILKTLRYNFEYKDWTNKIGLRNKGIDYAIKTYKKGEIISVAILTPTDIEPLLEKIPKDMDIEINISCPNVEESRVHQSANISQEPFHLSLSRFINPSRNWCIIKLSPICNTNEIDTFYNNGFRQFHCSNTFPVKEGGLSGKAIIPYNEKLIKYIKTNYNDCEVIGGGGIKAWNMVESYSLMGADHFAISTAAFCPYLFGILYWNIKTHSSTSPNKEQ